jgi:hypothetical protein
MVEESWKAVFPSLPFPVKFIGVLPGEAKKGVGDIQLGNGLVVLDVPNRFNLIVDSNLARFRRERESVTALKGVLDQKLNQPSPHTKHMFAAFLAASYCDCFKRFHARVQGG